ncbi:MAG: polysulfide reductase NrfD [Nitrospinae bacterium]|nr:polysulfide reductase NrfD [Nitrospinota bacterium]MBF0633350.1 polysulfide reductase NrfD [Nitrospinota bacterium]
MNITFTKVEGNSSGYWTFMALAGAVASLAPLTALYMFINGHHVTGMTNQVPWGMPIVMAVYLIGASAGSLVLSAMSSVFGRTEYKPFARIAAMLAVLLITAALMAIILDWGRPDRILVPFFHFQPRSMFSLNAILYNSYMLVGFLYLVAQFKNHEVWQKRLGLLAVFIAVGVHSGTGAIFGFVYVRELYGSPLLPPSFIAAALSSGTAMMIIVLHFTFQYTGRRLDERLIHGMARLMGVFMLIVLYFLFVENVTRAYAPKNYEAVSFLLLHGGKYTAIFWGGLIISGLVIPSLIVFNPKTSKAMGWILIASFLQLTGVLFERFIIVIPAQIMPLELFADKEITSVFMDGGYADYSVSLVEALYSVGLIGVVVFGFGLCIKLWPMIPEEAVHSSGDL